MPLTSAGGSLLDAETRSGSMADTDTGARGADGGGAAGGWSPMVSPRLDVPRALLLAERLYGLRGGHAKQLEGYDDQNFWLRPTEVAGNPHVSTPCASGYTLKAVNSRDSLNHQFFEEQTQLLKYLVDHGIRCPKPVKNKNGTECSFEVLEPGGPRHAVRLLEFVPGETLGKVPWQTDLAVQAGRELAKINEILQKLELPCIEARKIEWSLWEAPSVLEFLDDVLEDEGKRRLVREVLSTFSREVLPSCSALENDTHLIHGDYNQHNILVEQTETDCLRISGVLDFGDCHRAPCLFDVALAATYMAIHSGEVSAVAGVVKGYCERKSFQGVNRLKVCIAARICQSLIMGLKAHKQDPQNMYVLDSHVKGWQVLQQIWNAEPGLLEREWEEAASKSKSCKDS